MDEDERVEEQEISDRFIADEGCFEVVDDEEE